MISGISGISEQEKEGFKQFVFSKWEAALNSFRDDLSVFCRDYLGYKKINEQHIELCKMLVKGKKFKLVLMPRYSFKSCICTIGYSLWRLLFNPNLRILIYSDATTKAEGFLTGIKNHIEGKAAGSTFRDIFGSWETDPNRKGKWSNREIVISKRTSGHSESTVETAGIGTSLTGKHYDIIIFDDIVSDTNCTTKEQMDKAANSYQKALSLLVPNGEVIIVGCLVAGSKVLRSEGAWENIENIKVGEKVITYDDGGWKDETVEAMIPQGKAEVFELKTQNHTIEATANHPFLKFVNNEFKFTPLDKLNIGDTILSYGKKSSGKHSEFSEEDFWALGFMFGDGWITLRTRRNTKAYVTCFAKGVDDDLNNKVLNHFQNKFDFKFKETKFGYYRTEIARVAKFLENMGFKGKAKTKRIPKYIFNLSLKYRLNFIKGFIDADGHNDGKSLRVEICNKDLMKDFQLLCSISGYKVSNIYHRERISQPPHSPRPVVAQSYHISMGLKPNCPSMRMVKVKSIKPKGIKEVYDLTVSNTHNFIAEGMVVHNTRWDFGDLYGRILAKDEDNSVFDVILKDAEEKKDGKLIFEDIGLTKEFLAFQKNEQGSYLYSCLYRNNPVDPETAVFKTVDFSFYNTIDPIDLYITGTCDPAGMGDDPTAITVVGTDNNMKMYILDIVNKTKLQIDDIVEEIIRLHYKWKFRIFGVEVNFYRGALKQELDRCIQQEWKNNPANFPNFGLHEFKATARRGEGKENRISSLEPYHRRGDLKFPGKRLELLEGNYSELANQMIKFPRAPHDDILDSLAYHLPLSRKGGTVKESGPPLHSPAWIDRHLREKEIARQGELPRYLRSRIRPLIYN